MILVDYLIVIRLKACLTLKVSPSMAKISDLIVDIGIIY